MKFRLLKSEENVQNFVKNYKNSFDYLYEVSLYNYKDQNVTKESILEYFEFMYKNCKMDRFIKDYVLVFCELEQTNKIQNYNYNYKNYMNYLGNENEILNGEYYVNLEKYYNKKDGIYLNQELDSFFSYSYDSKFAKKELSKKVFLYDILKTIEKYIPKGILLDESRTINEEEFKKFIGIKYLNIGTEFEIEFKDDENNYRLYKFTLLEYKKEIRAYQFVFMLFFNKNYANYNSLNIFEKHFFDLSNWSLHINTERYSLLNIFFSSFFESYNLYMNYKYNKNYNYIIDLFDYGKNEVNIRSYITGYREDIVLDINSNNYEKNTKLYLCLDYNDYKNYDIERAHSLYIQKILYDLNYKSLKFRLYLLEELSSEDPYLWDFNDIQLLKEYFLDKGILENRFYDIIPNHPGPIPLKDWNIWILGSGKYLNIFEKL